MDKQQLTITKYFLARSNAIWFAKVNDGYSIQSSGDKVTTVEKGWCVKCSASFLEECESLFKLLSAQNVGHGHTTMMKKDTTFSVDSPAEVRCHCLECTKKDVERIISERK